MRSTDIPINPKHWSKAKQEIKDIAAATDKDKINNNLRELSSFILKSYREDSIKGVLIGSGWLQEIISKKFNKVKETDLSLFGEYGEYFIRNLPNKVNHSKGGKIGVGPRTIAQYKNVIRRIRNFEKNRGKKLFIHDINLKFEREHIAYLKDVENYGSNTIGRQITFIKTICFDAMSSGIKTDPQLSKLRGFTTEAKFIYFNENEIDRIYSHDFSDQPYLDNARDWLMIALRTGQRISDFMNFNKDNIMVGPSGGRFIEFVQEKTGKRVVVPIKPNGEVDEILRKNGGEFPRKIADQNFNKYIKEVSRKVGFIEFVEGSKTNTKTKRKEVGKYEKWELVTSHIGRRSFATNHYGKIPTPVIMGITGHSNERQFLAYIGKSQVDDAEYLLKFWETQESMPSIKTEMRHG